MRLTLRKNRKNIAKDSEINSFPASKQEHVKVANDEDDFSREGLIDSPEADHISNKLPKELLIRIFSYLDVVSVSRCAQVSKYWNTLALDGSNWQYVDLFNFQKEVNLNVLENISKRCNDFLKAIRLENCRFLTDDAIKTLCTNCHNIEFLDMKHCTKLTDSAFVQLGSSLSNLKTLYIQSCAIEDNGLNKISNGCSKLQSIDISWCKGLSTSSIINLTKSCTNLQYFSCKGLKNVNDSVLKSVAQNCANLISLNLNNCHNISDAGMVELAAACVYLKHVYISNCKYLSDASLKALGQNCDELMTFECAGCNNFSDNGFACLTKNCHNLTRIDLEECTRITDLTLQNLASNCNNLRHLTLSRCECITDEGIKFLGLRSSYSPLNESLQVLELDNCPLITDASLEQLYACQSLIKLELYDCQSITRGGIKKLQEKMPQLNIHTYFAPNAASNQTNNARPTRSCSCKCCTIL